ncbi:MAG: hypothetical protein P8X74_22775 [Reinekea sp.]
MLPKNWGEPAILEQQVEIKLLHSASTEEITDSGLLDDYSTAPTASLSQRHE